MRPGEATKGRKSLPADDISIRRDRMNEKDRVSTLSSWLVGAAAVAFGIIGSALFFAPAWAAANFPWKISPFVAMTMGGWYLGSGVMASLVLGYRRWGLVYANLIFAGVFALTEILV